MLIIAPHWDPTFGINKYFARASTVQRLAIAPWGLRRTFSFLVTVKCWRIWLSACGGERSPYQPTACSEVLQSSSTSFQGGILLALIHQGQVGVDGIRVVEPAGSFGFKILLRKGDTILIILQREEKMGAQILLFAHSPCRGWISHFQASCGTSYLHFTTPAIETACESFVHINAPGHVVELGVFVGNFSIQAVGEVVQDADAILHRLKHPPE